jgi:hypothetical protein
MNQSEQVELPLKKYLLFIHIFFLEKKTKYRRGKTHLKNLASQIAQGRSASLTYWSRDVGKGRVESRSQTCALSFPFKFFCNQ